jgi:mono/diheme cytochrome c family protein
MSRLHLAAGALALALLGSAASAQPADAPPPPRPQGGEALFKARCGICHAGMGPGVLTLTKRLGKDKSLIAERSDLDPNYVKGVVRRGLNSMPPLGRVEITDAELAEIAAYLTRNHGKAAP